MNDSEVLLRARLFQSANPDVERRLAAIRPRARAVAAGQLVFEHAEEADAIYVLAAARDVGPAGSEPIVQVRLTENGTGRAVRFARIVKGDIFGEAELVWAGLDAKACPRITSARALTPSRIIALAWADLVPLLDLDPAIRTRFLKLATRRFLDAVWAQHSERHEDPDIVLADWLVEFAADLGVPTSNRVSFPRKLSQTEIADELGVSRETISRRLKEWERSGLVISSSAGLEVVDYSRLVRIAGLHSGRDRQALSRAVADVAGEVERGDLIGARNIGADMLRYFPASPQLIHLVALAAARSGDPDESTAILKGAGLVPDGDFERLRERVARGLKNPFASAERIAAADWLEDGFADDEDEDESADARLLERLTGDLAALEARILKDRAFGQGATCDADVAGQSQRAYAATWRRAGNWYAGINAATMALASGDRKEARKIAGEILKRVGDDPKDYWAAATRAEALIISGDRKAGLAALAEAGAAEDASDSHRATTALQLRRLAGNLSLDMAEVSARLGIKTVAATTGHMFRASEMDAAAQDEAESLIRARAETILSERRVGNLFGALACGTDVVLAEAALDADIPFHAVLPFPTQRFAELSAAPGDPEGDPGKWRKRLEGILARAASFTLMDDEIPLDRDLDGHFFYGFRFMTGMALMRASVLEAECRLIAVTDGSTATNIAGSNRAAADWIEAGRPIDHIPFPHPRKPVTGRARGTSSFRACVLLWDVTGGRGDRDALARAGVADDSRLRVVPRTSRLGRDGSAIVVPGLEDAIRLAEACADEAGALRIICDFGPVLGADLEPDPKMVARLKAGSDMPGFPTGRPIATLNFAAQAVMEVGSRLDVRAVGRAEEPRSADGEDPQRLRRRSGLPVYRLGLRNGGAA